MNVPPPNEEEVKATTNVGLSGMQANNPNSNAAPAGNTGTAPMMGGNDTAAAPMAASGGNPVNPAAAMGSNIPPTNLPPASQQSMPQAAENPMMRQTDGGSMLPQSSTAGGQQQASHAYQQPAVSTGPGSNAGQPNYTILSKPPAQQVQGSQPPQQMGANNNATGIKSSIGGPPVGGGQPMRMQNQPYGSSTGHYGAGQQMPQQSKYPKSSSAMTFNPDKPMKELKVEDALLYLDQVKQQFGDQPAIYNQFLDVMKNFKTQAIDTPGVINRVSTLFKGYPKLILGFNTFLPPGFKIRADATYEMARSMPQSASGYPGSGGMQQGGVEKDRFGKQQSHMPSEYQPKYPASGMSSKDQAMPGMRPSNAPPRAAYQSQEASRAAQPVEFDHAITYVTTIKKRFYDEPETYKSFLEILHTYQKEQRSIKEVLDQVSHLFRDHPDLLREFTYFLPDAAQHEAKVKLNHEADKAVERKRVLKRKLEKKEREKGQKSRKKLSPMSGDRDLERQKWKYGDKKSRKKMYDSKERRNRFALEESGVLPSEWQFFEKARRALPTRDTWREFLKCLDLYSQEVLGQDEMLSLVTNLFGRHKDIVADFKKLLDEHGSRDSHNDTWFSMPLAEIDFSKCRRCTPSYRALPASYPNPPCSVRSALEKDVCNDAWVSVPTGSEDFSFKSMRKNQYEEALFKCEDERFEIDMLIDANACTIRILEPLAKEISLLQDTENPQEAKWQYRIDRRTFGTIHINAISRVYGESGGDILELLRKHPAGAIPVILERLKQKDSEWRRARQELNKQWKEVNEKNYHKSLDHCSFYFKQHDKKQISTKGLVSEAKLKLREATDKESEAKKDGEDEKEKNIWEPHFGLEFAEPSIHRISYALLQYAAEHNVSTADKERLAKLWKSSLLPFLNLPEDWLTSKPEMIEKPTAKDEILKAGVEVKTSFGEGTIEKYIEEDGTYKVALRYGQAFLLPNNIQVPEKEVYPPTVCMSDDRKYLEKDQVDSLSSENVNLLYESQAAYVFYRLYHILYLRVLEAKRLCAKAKRNQKTITINPAARALSHSHHTDDKSDKKAGDFDAFLSYLYALVDGSIDNAKYEDCCRNLMGSSSFLLFTMDKLVSQLLKQLQTMGSDDTSIELQKLSREENSRSEPVVPSEYFNKAKGLFDGEDVYRIQFNCGVLRHTNAKPADPTTPQSTVSDDKNKIWAPSPRVNQNEVCPWLVKPKISIEYLGDLEEDDEGTPEGSPEASPGSSPSPDVDTDSKSEDKKRKTTATVSTDNDGPATRKRRRDTVTSLDEKKEGDEGSDGNKSAEMETE